MKKVLIKIIIAIAIGVIAGQIAGNKFENEKYFAFHKKHRDKVEISEEEYNYVLEDVNKTVWGIGEKPGYYINPTKEVSFNKQLFRTVFMCVTAVITILLLLPELRERKSD